MTKRPTIAQLHGQLVVFSRLLAILTWTAAVLPAQLVLNRRPGNAKVVLPLRYWSGVASILGIRINVVGTVARNHRRPVVFVANHASWLDIVVLGAVLPGCFIAKADVGRWPIVRTIAGAGRTIFVSRQRASTKREQSELGRRLNAGDNLILFPEGTTSDGARILPFRSSFLALAEQPQPPIVQPVTIVFDQLDGLPVCRRNRPLIAWYGDMEIASHYARIGQHNLRATVVLDEPVDPAIGRKELSRALETTIENRAAELRQGRIDDVFIRRSLLATGGPNEKA